MHTLVSDGAELLQFARDLAADFGGPKLAQLPDCNDATQERILAQIISAALGFDAITVFRDHVTVNDSTIAMMLAEYFGARAIPTQRRYQSYGFYRVPLPATLRHLVARYELGARSRSVESLAA